MDALVALSLATLAIAFVGARARADGGVTLDALALGCVQWLAVVGALGTALGLVGFFTPTMMAEACLMVAALIGARAYATPRRSEPRDPLPTRVRWVLLAIVTLGAALRLPPMPSPLAGHDQGTYRLRAEAQARSGALELRDPLLEELHGAHPDELGVADIVNLYPRSDTSAMRGWYEAPHRPGFYLKERDRGRITAQFFHLHPSVLAAFVLAAPAAPALGVGLATWVAGLAALLALAGLARRLVGDRWALFAVVSLAIAPTAVWTHRNPLSEGLFGALVTGAALAWARASDPGDRDARLGAWLLGAATVVRGDAWLWGPLVAAAWWARRGGSGSRAAPRVFVACLVAGGALHAWTSYPYVHDEIARHWPALLTTPHALVATWVAIGIGWFLVDTWVADRLPWSRWSSLAPAAGVLVVTTCLVLVWSQHLPTRPFSRLHLAPAALGVPLVVGGVAGATIAAWSRASAPGFVGLTLTIPVVLCVLYVPRNLPASGLYYYGRYLVPVLLPAAGVSTAYALRTLARGGRPRRTAAAIVALVTVAALAHVLARSVRTRIVELAATERAIEFLGERAGFPAVVVAGGEGWHSGFTFNQIGGALMFRHGADVVPYTTREAAHASLLALTSSRRRPAYLLVNEASHHYTREDGEVVAGADDLLSAPLVAESVELVEIYTHVLTPDLDRPPVRLTRQALRATLIGVVRDDTSLLHRIDFGRELPEDAGIDVTQLGRAGGGVCLDPRRPLRIPLPSSLTDGPAEITIVGTWGSSQQTPRLDVRLDGRRAPVDQPARARDVLGPFLAPTVPRHLEIRGAKADPASLCLHGGVRSITVGPAPRSAMLSAATVDATAFVPLDDRGDPFKISGWVPGRALTRFRPGTRGAEIRALSLRMRHGRALSFAPATIPAAIEHDVVVTMTGSSLSPEARVELWIDGNRVERFDPPDRIKGSWQGPKTRVSGLSTVVDVRVELVHSAPGDTLDVRDVAFFAVARPVRPRVVRAP